MELWRNVGLEKFKKAPSALAVWNKSITFAPQSKQNPSFMNSGNLFQNEMLISAVAAWLVAQVLKMVIGSIENKHFEWHLLFTDGGMPSCHSATVSALATSAAICHGMGSGMFAVTAILAIVVMHDASGIRLQSGKHAELINEIVEILKTEHFPNDVKKLKEVLGHTHLQVTFGLLLGIAVAFICHLLFP